MPTGFLDREIGLAVVVPALTVTVPPAGVYFSALSRRLLQ